MTGLKGSSTLTLATSLDVELMMNGVNMSYIELDTLFMTILTKAGALLTRNVSGLVVYRP